MGEKTPIEWCDSAANPVMGCDGCELWIPEKKIEHCYAGTLHKIRAGRPGYADRFDEPKLFPGRMAKAAKWSDLRGTERPDKPWLNGMPRMIFVSDMGDALSRDVPLEYLRDEVIEAARSEKGQRHILLWLTKQPARMLKLSLLLKAQGIEWPRNLWAGTSVTSQEQTARINQLLRVPAAVRFVSYEPALGPVDFSQWLDASRASEHRPHTWIHWLIVGGESGPGARKFDIAWARSAVQQCRDAKVPVFVKQLGARPVDESPLPVDPDATAVMQEILDWHNHGVREKVLGRILDRKGGNPAEWPEDLRVREVPSLA